ncbi:MAG: cupin domain-containing protein [Sphingomonadales bacterium]|nr:MAG: cupin domain-containing protein [Sphingomonadales bacterium]
MSFHDNAYTAFMLDSAAGALPPAEQLVADVHRALSPGGRQAARLFDTVGGLMLERIAPHGQVSQTPPGLLPLGQPIAAGQADPERSSRLDPYLRRDLIALKWRKDIFGVKTHGTDTPMASMLRLDPGQRAPAHSHGRRDVTVVLCGSYADEYGVYERGDLAFAEPGMRHEPRAVGNEPCVCLLATEAGRPLLGFFGLFGVGVRKQKDAS